MAGEKPSKSIIQVQLKLKLRSAQERMLGRWLWKLTGVWNWAVKKIEADANDGIYHSRYDLEALLTGHGAKIGIPSHVVQEMAREAHGAWRRCFKKLSGRPRLKGRRNRLSYIPFHDRMVAAGNRIGVPGLGRVAYHAQPLPDGLIKCGRLLKRASGWYLCLFIQAEPRVIPCLGVGEVGIDPGFSSLLTLSTGEKIEHPRELEASAVRLGQAQRGKRKRLTARLHERIGNQRKDRNHKLSRRLVSENALIVFSADQHSAIARVFGKSVSSSGHSQLRRMLAYKSSRTGGREYIEVASRNSTRICSACGQKTGPTGFAELKVRAWACSACGAEHDRDVNAARNTLRLGRGLRLERVGDGSSGIAA